MNEKVSAYFDGLRGKRIAVLGIGVSNRPLIRMLLARGLTVLACDKTSRDKLDEEVLELEKLGATLHVGDGYLDGVQADIVFRTPGMHPDIPALKQLREAGAVVTSEMEAFFAVCPCRIIAVTGSDGKTTTTTLISEILKHAGYTVWLGGNIGTPLLPRAEEMNPGDIAVVELSSFQLMGMTQSADIAVVTNLAPHHLDVHKDMAEYIAAKENVYAASGQNRQARCATWTRRSQTRLPKKRRARLRNSPGLAGRRTAFGWKTASSTATAGRSCRPPTSKSRAFIISRTTWPRPARRRGSCRTRMWMQWRGSFGGVEHRIELVRELQRRKVLQRLNCLEPVADDCGAAFVSAEGHFDCGGLRQAHPV